MNDLNRPDGVSYACLNFSPCTVNALVDILDGFGGQDNVSFPFWGSSSDPCGLEDGGSEWGGVICQKINDCTTTVSGLYAPLTYPPQPFLSK